MVEKDPTNTDVPLEDLSSNVFGFPCDFCIIGASVVVEEKIKLQDSQLENKMLTKIIK